MDSENQIEPGASEGIVIEIEKVLEYIPHRYPFLMVDRVVDLVVGESAVGIKNVTINEPFFQGHFPGKPIMPGVLIIESMAQTSAVLVVETLGGNADGKIVYFMAIDGAKFRHPVIPGDRVEIHITKKQNRGAVWKFYGEAKVEGKVVAEASFTAMIVDK